MSGANSLLDELLKVEPLLKARRFSEALRSLDALRAGARFQDEDGRRRFEAFRHCARALAQARPKADRRSFERLLGRVGKTKPGFGPMLQACLQWLAEKRLTQGRGAEAQALCRLLLSDASADPVVPALLFFEAGLRLGKRRAGEAAARAALKRIVEDPAKRLDAFQLSAAIGDYKTAFALAEKLLDQGLSLAQARLLWYPWSARLSDLIRASERARLDALARSSKAQPWAQYYRACLGSDDETSLWDCLRVLRRYPARRYGWMRVKSGWALLHQKSFEEAVAEFKAAASHPPVDWRAHGFMAEALLALHRADAARRALRRGIRAAPPEEKADAVAWLGAIELWSGRYQRALKHLNAANASGARWAPCWKAGALIMLGRPARALVPIEEALRSHPGDQEALVWKAEALRLLKRPREALRALEGVSGPWARANRALASADLGDGDGARRHLDGFFNEVAASGVLGEPGERLKEIFKRARGYRVGGAILENLLARRAKNVE